MQKKGISDGKSQATQNATPVRRSSYGVHYSHVKANFSW